jgi:hypothetical protein
MQAQAYSPRKGLAWGAAHLYPYDYTRLNVSWVYNWEYRPAKFDATSPFSGTHASELLPGGVEYIPMIYCVDLNADSDDDGVYDHLEEARDYLGTDDYVTSTWDGYLLILNEPWIESECGGTLTTMREVTEAYVAIRSTFPSAKLIGPNTHHNSLNPLYPPGKLAEWREDVKAYTGTYPDVAGFGVHTYTGDPDENLGYVERLHSDLLNWQQQEGRVEPYELWVTELGYCGDPSDQEAADNITQTVYELEALGYIDRYAYYANRTHPWRINLDVTCWHDDSVNNFLFVELYGGDPADPEDLGVCSAAGFGSREECKNLLNYAIFSGFINEAIHFDLTLKGIAYKETGALR